MTWSKIRDKLENEYLAESLRGHIQYFATSYSKCPDHEGRAAVRLDGEEILKSNYFDMMQALYDAKRRIRSENPEISYREAWLKSGLAALNDGYFDQRDFYAAFAEFDNQSIECSLDSENALVRMFAVLDRRVGKRRLERLADRIASEPEWLRAFYLIRLRAENICERDLYDVERDTQQT
ncbi:MAG: hypothetical protein K2G32_05355 [Oscillospiraceae bacterium]|nr:hypothetical protein [Oscillospiraceae bacterium]